MKKTALPKMLSFSAPDLREQIEALPEGTALIGISTDGRAIAVDLDTDCPHVLVCTSTGGGSTTVLRSLTAQFLHQGAHALVLDAKRVSHPWARGLASVTYCADIADIHEALVHLRAELSRRIHHIDQHGDTGDLTRLTVVFEVAHHTLTQLARHWSKVRQAGDPKTSPAVDAFHEVLYAGRAARIHVLYNGSTSGSLDPAIREHFATVILARVSAGTWQRLAPIAGPAPKSSAHPGRAHVVKDDIAHPTQLLFMTDAEAADWLAATAAGTI
ncbi:hypothetical protein [Streptomyces vinaceus]|uniref:hypothetical protein n=1 Tax=Streptomyces vinaceus TaxID=1960 RepID=UPI00368039D6